MGNAFLSHIRAVDGIFQCVRIFDNEEIVHVEGEVDPIRDLQIIHEELRLKDIEILEKKVDALAKVAVRVDKTKKAELVCSGVFTRWWKFSCVYWCCVQFLGFFEGKVTSLAQGWKGCQNW